MLIACMVGFLGGILKVGDLMDWDGLATGVDGCSYAMLCYAARYAMLYAVLARY
jgi:hypothetical protein